MSSKKDSYYLNLLQQMISQANQPSPVQSQQQTDYANLRKFLTPTDGSAPDYRDPIGHGVVTGMLPLSEYQKQLNTLAPVPGQGASAQLTSRQNALSNDQLAQNYGSEYQDRLNQLMGGQNALGATLANDIQNTNNLNLRGQSAYLNALRNRAPGFWGQFGGGLLQGAANAGLKAFGNWYNNRGSNATINNPGTDSYPNPYGGGQYDYYGGTSG